jgi:putative membrane protein
VYADLHLNAQEHEYVASQDNMPNAILNLIQFKISELHEQGKMQTLLYQNIDQTLQRLCDAMGKCERIKTPSFLPSTAFL